MTEATNQECCIMEISDCPMLHTSVAKHSQNSTNAALVCEEIMLSCNATAKRICRILFCIIILWFTVLKLALHANEAMSIRK